MLAVGMLEEIIDPELLHQSADKCEIGFPVLYAVLDRAKVALGAKFEITEASLGEDILDDVLDALLQENPAIGLVPEEPEPRAEHQPVVEEILLPADPTRFREDSVVEAFLVLEGLELDSAGLTNRLVEIDLPVFAHCLNVVFKQLAQPFRALESRQYQLILERRVEFGRALALTKLCVHLFLASRRDLRRTISKPFSVVERRPDSVQ